MVYEVKSPHYVQVNYDKLLDPDGSYFYWNKSRFANINIGDPVFVVNPTEKEVLFTRREGDFIVAEYDSVNDSTTIPDPPKLYQISGEWDEFIRLRIQSKREITSSVSWNTLGSSETTYLFGPNANAGVAENNLQRAQCLRQIFADDPAATELLDRCIEELQQHAGVTDPETGAESTSSETFDSAELFGVLQRYESETILFQSSEGGAGYSVESDGTRYAVHRLDAFEHESVSRQTYLNLRGKLREHGGRMRFTEFNGTAAIRNCILQAVPLALSPDRKDIIDVSDPEKRIELFCDILKQLKVDRSREEPKLYKPAMLACVIEAIEEGELSENKIPFDWIAPRFIAKMADLGEEVGNDQAAQAFCHLKGDMIWLHAVVNPRDPMKDGREGPSAAREKVKYALIKDTFWTCLEDPVNLERAMTTIQSHWFGVSNSPQFWWVNQGATFKQALEGGFIWAPSKDKGGNTPFHWKNVQSVREGDVVFNYADGEVRALSLATTSPFESDKEVEGGQWEHGGWRVDLLCHQLSNPIDLQDIGLRLASLGDEYSPINHSGGVNQGYLFRLSEEAVQIILSHLKGENMPDEIQSILPPPQDLTHASTLDDSFIPAVTSAIKDSGLIFEEEFLQRFLFSLLAKPFVILTGTSGTGKTQLALKFAQWLVGEEGYELVPVGADWTDNRQVLGQYNPFDKAFVSTRVLDILLQANSDPARPYFLILDEMNLSHVERYFADFLSGIESGDSISLHRNGDDVKTAKGVTVPEQIKIPNNLFIVGTVNIDETTYMFSPKVLDRANVLEFSISKDGFNQFFENPVGKLTIDSGGGSGHALGFLEHAKQIQKGSLGRTEIEDHQEEIRKTLLELFGLLEGTGMEFAYRTASEIERFCRAALSLITSDEWELAPVLDAQILQKVLPKLHGSRRQIEPLLASLCEYCKEADLEAAEKRMKQFSETFEPKPEGNNFIFPLSYHKLAQMIEAVRRDQFVSFIQ